MLHKLLSLALATARRDEPRLRADDLAVMCTAVQMDVLSRPSPIEAWIWLAEALMSPYPAHFFESLRACGGLKRFMPELDALYGVPQLCDGPDPVDVGVHQMRLVNATARVNAPLSARFAALMHKIGKGGTPREIWPSHYKHEQRAHALLDQLALRVAIPNDTMDLTRLVIDECDRVHRVNDVRAGPIAAMLDRVHAVDQPERFDQLMTVCACDYAAYPGHRVADYPKAPNLRLALSAYVDTDVHGLNADAALMARAQSIADALHSVSSPN